MTLYRIPINATTPGLDVGIPIFFPRPGDILRDAWFEVVEAWNATPAFADVGTFLGGYDHGLYGSVAGAPVDVTQPDFPPDALGGVLVGQTESDLAVAAGLGKATPATAFRAAPARFMSAAPLLAVVSTDGTNGGAGTYAKVEAAGAPDIPAAVPATVTADAALTLEAGADAYVVAAGEATVPTTVVEGVNDTFKFGPPGEELIWTVAPGDYTTLAELEAAMLAALVYGTQPLSTVVGLTDDGTTITATSTTAGAAYNGWDFLTGATDFLAASGIEGVNDTFEYGQPSAEVAYTVAPSSYGDGDAVAVAMAAATNSDALPLSASVGIAFDAGSGKLVATAVYPGTGQNGDDFLTGATDFLAGAGFTSGQALEGGVDAGLVVIEGTNDTFKFGQLAVEQVYTVAPGTYADAAALAAAMAAATNPEPVPLSDFVAMTVDSDTGALVATAVEEGAGPNGWDFVTGATDFLAGSGFTSGQALGGGTGGTGGPTGATAGLVNLYLDVETPYPAPAFASPAPNAPPFPYVGKV
jgi:hypothetical protein